MCPCPEHLLLYALSFLPLMGGAALWLRSKFHKHDKCDSRCEHEHGGEKETA